MNIVITTGARYTDIDAYACVMCYAAALEMAGMHARVLLKGPLNASVTPELRAVGWPGLDNDLPLPPRAPCVLMDMSAPAHMPPEIDVDHVIQVFDHHPGHEAFWRERIGKAACIEAVGAAATLVWERIVAMGLARYMHPREMQLMASAIVSNTVGMASSIAHKRDAHALEDLQSRAGLRRGWEAAYFSQVEARIEADFVSALRHDTKTARLPDGRSLSVAQMELGHAGAFIARKREAIGILTADRMLLNMPSRDEGCTYLVCGDGVIQAALQARLGVVFADGIAVLGDIVMRKHLMPVLEGPVTPTHPPP